MMKGRAVFVLVLWAGIAACGESDATFPDSGAPSAIVRPFSVDFQPRALFGGTSAVATVHLSSPAPAGGLAVALSSGDEAVVVPASILIPAGQLSADFAVNTSPVVADVIVSLQASAAGRSATGSLPVWAQLPAYFSWMTEPLFSGASRIGRLSSANATFTASCRGSQVHIGAHGAESWFVGFGAPRDQALRIGTYENAENTGGVSTNIPSLSVRVGQSSIGCFTPAGRFVVHEVEVRDDGSVPRFRATFEQRCGAALALSGEVRVTNPPSDRSPFDRTPCFR